MAYWLFKEEPDHFNFSDLERDGKSLWDGVANSLARQHLQKVIRGDRIYFYHTGKERAIVGEMRAVGSAKADPSTSDPKALVVEVKAVRRLPRPVTLPEIKADAKLRSWDLVRLPRLSVVPVSEEQWHRVKELSEKLAG